MAEMRHPLRENLEVFDDDAGTWIRCTRCSHVFCKAEEDWRQASKSKLFPPTKAGPLMKDLVGRFLLKQLYCPGCAALLSSDIVEDENAAKGSVQDLKGDT